jgi:elongation factor 2
MRNVALCAHVDHGKTTVADRLLQAAGKLSDTIAAHARVLDQRDDEITRGITIEASLASFEYNNHLFHLVDTPGHIDFNGEVAQTLSVCDNAIIIIDALEGIMPQTKTVMKEMVHEKVKPFLILNKLDRLFEEVGWNINHIFQHCSQIIDTCNMLLQSSSDDLPLKISNGTVLFASAKQGWAIHAASDLNLLQLMELAVEERAKRAPLGVQVLQTLINNGVEPHKFANCPRDAAALVVKQEYLQNQALIYALKDLTNTPYYVGEESVALHQNAKQGSLFLHPNIPFAPGAYLSSTTTPHAIEPKVFSYVTPKLVEQKIEPLTQDDFAPLCGALSSYAKKDPQFSWRITPKGDMVVSGVGSLYLDVILETIKQKIPLSIHPVQILKIRAPASDQTITTQTTSFVIKKTSVPECILNGTRQYVYTNDAQLGFCTITSTNTADNKDALQDALHRIKTTLLEPVQHIRIQLPHDMLGQVQKILGQKKASITQMQAQTHEYTLHASVRLAHALTLSEELASATKGQTHVSITDASFEEEKVN